MYIFLKKNKKFNSETPAMAYGQVTVRIVGADVTPEITTRTFDITHPNSPQPRRVTQFQVTAILLVFIFCFLWLFV